MSKVWVPCRTAVCVAAVLLLSVSPLAAQEPLETPLSLSGVVDLERPRAAAPGPEAPRPGALLPLYMSFATLQAFDVHSTLRALDGGAREANPVMRGIVGRPAALFAIKAGSTAGLIYLTEKLWKQNRTLAILTMIGVNGAYLAVVSHNYSVGK